VRWNPLIVVACVGLTACATPENRRELYGPWYPYKPIPYTAPPRDSNERVIQPVVAPRDNIVHYGPDQRRLIVGTWGGGGKRPSMRYPSTPWSMEKRIISRYNTKGLSAQEIAERDKQRALKAAGEMPPPEQGPGPDGYKSVSAGT
jgi:hypothetical protein